MTDTRTLLLGMYEGRHVPWSVRVSFRWRAVRFHLKHMAWDMVERSVSSLDSHSIHPHPFPRHHTPKHTQTPQQYTHRVKSTPVQCSTQGTSTNRPEIAAPTPRIYSTLQRDCVLLWMAWFFVAGFSPATHLILTSPHRTSQKTTAQHHHHRHNQRRRHKT